MSDAALVFELSGILFPENLSSIGTTWGAVTVAGGIAFVLAAEWARHTDRSLETGST
jgi:hypothetical protein